MGLSSEFANSRSLKTIQRILCLPLLPQESISEAFSTIRRDNSVLVLNNWLQYVEQTWIRSRRFPSLSVFGMRHRTNNFAESTFSVFSTQLMPHPQLFKFLEFLIKRSNRDFLDIQRLANSQRIRRPQVKSIIDRQKMIMNANERLTNHLISPIEFLDSLRNIPNTNIDITDDEPDLEIDEQNQNDESFDISEELEEEINFDDLPFAGRTLNEPVIDFLAVYRHNPESETNQCVVCHFEELVEYVIRVGT